MRFRDFRRIDRRPGEATDVPRRVHVCVVGVPTGHAAKLRLRWAVGFGYMPANRARLAGIGRVDVDDLNACQPGFVFDKCTKLRKSPPTHLRPLRLAKPCPVADALEFLQGKPATGAFGLSNERFGYAMILVGAKSPFLPAQALELAPDVLRTHASPLFGRSSPLETGAQCVLPTPDGFDRIAAVVLPVAVGGDIGHSEIDADEVGRWRLGAVWQIDGHKQEPLAILAQDEITLPLGGGKPFLLILAHDHGHENATRERQKRHAINALEAHQPLVIGDSGKRTKLRSLGLVPLVGFADLRNAAHRHLGRQSESLAQLSVAKLLQQDFVGGLSCKRLAGQPVGCFVEGAHGRLKQSGLLRGRQKLRLQGQLHTCNYRRIGSICQPMGAALPPPTEVGGFRAGNAVK